MGGQANAPRISHGIETACVVAQWHGRARRKHTELYEVYSCTLLCLVHFYSPTSNGSLRSGTGRKLKSLGEAVSCAGRWIWAFLGKENLAVRFGAPGTRVLIPRSGRFTMTACPNLSCLALGSLACTEHLLPLHNISEDFGEVQPACEHMISTQQLAATYCSQCKRRTSVHSPHVNVLQMFRVNHRSCNLFDAPSMNAKLPPTDQT